MMRWLIVCGRHGCGRHGHSLWPSWLWPSWSWCVAVMVVAVMVNFVAVMVCGRHGRTPYLLLLDNVTYLRCYSGTAEAINN